MDWRLAVQGKKIPVKDEGQILHARQNGADVSVCPLPSRPVIRIDPSASAVKSQY